MGRFCHGCGAQMRPGALFCPQCGASDARQAAASVKPRNRGFPLRVAVSIAVALLVAAGGYLGWTYYKKIGVFATTALYDVELVAQDKGKKNQYFASHYHQNVQAASLRMEAQAYCQKRRQENPAFDGCGVFVLASGKTFPTGKIEGGAD